MHLKIQMSGLDIMYKAIDPLVPKAIVDSKVDVDDKPIREALAKSILEMPESDLTSFVQFVLDFGH